MSGLSHTPGKRAWVNPHRGFESRLLRQLPIKKKRPFRRFLILMTKGASVAPGA